MTLKRVSIGGFVLLLIAFAVPVSRDTMFSWAFILASKVSPRIPTGPNTPIVVTGSSIILDSYTPWTQVGTSNAYQGTISRPLTSIALTSKNVPPVPIFSVSPGDGVQWTIHLIAADTGDSTIAGTLAPTGSVTLVTVTPEPNGRWFANGKTLTLIPNGSGSNKIVQVGVDFNGVSQQNAACQTTAFNYTITGWCYINTAN